MTRAPYITNDTRRRRLYLLRTNHLTLIKLSIWQKLMTPIKSPRISTKCWQGRPRA
jgi:hypothetical protein